MVKFLITGANGQLAKEFIKFFEQNNKDFVALSKQQLDITDFNKVLECIKEIKPDAIINCAAYNLVDNAEIDDTPALKVNFEGVKNLATVCRDKNIFLVHFSTDYVFDGEKEGLYVEEDVPNPINKYGKSKLLGENFIKENLEKFLVFRISWLYGEGKQNFLYKLVQWTKTQQYLKIACDEFSVPTSTKTVVEVTIKAVEKNLYGLYHLVNSGYASRYELAKKIFEIKGINKFIYPIYQKDFNLPAKRPKFSAMDNTKLKNILNIEIPFWEEELRRIFSENKQVDTLKL